MSRTAAATRLSTAGLSVDVRSEVPRRHDEVMAATGGRATTLRDPAAPADVSLVLEAARQPFDAAGCELVTRGVWTDRERVVVLDDVGGSGYSQRWTIDDHCLHVRSRWSPSSKARLAATLLPARFRALQAQVLLHYPALWWAASRGRVPLHVSVVEVDGVAVILAGPGGVGKSTLVYRELYSGATATCDNVAVSSGDRLYGLCEPLRLAGRSGRRTTQGRRELPWIGRVPELDPQLLVVVRRGDPAWSGVSRIEPDAAARALVGGTYAAGELQRFWPLCAMIGLATGWGPAHPRVEDVARSLCSRLPCYQLAIAGRADDSLASLLREPLLELQQQGAPT